MSPLRLELDSASTVHLIPELSSNSTQYKLEHADTSQLLKGTPKILLMSRVGCRIVRLETVPFQHYSFCYLDT